MRCSVEACSEAVTLSTVLVTGHNDVLAFWGKEDAQSFDGRQLVGGGTFPPVDPTVRVDARFGEHERH